MKENSLINRIAVALEAISRLKETQPDSERCGKWEDRLNTIERDVLPSGGGFDSGTTIDRVASTSDRIVFVTAFHHMSQSGYYVGWTEHKIIVTPSFVGGFNLKISGQDKHGIKDYIRDVFSTLLSDEYEYPVIDGAK